MDLRLLNITAACGLIILSIFILYLGKALILPLVIALVFWYIIIHLANWLNKLHLNKMHLPYGLCLLIAIIITAAVLYLFFLLLSHSIANILTESPKYQAKLQFLFGKINQWLGDKLDIKKLLSKVDLANLFSKLAIVISSLASNFILIVIYLLFLLLEHRTFDTKLQAMCQKPTKYQKVRKIFDRIDQEINVYLKYKTAINAVAGIASYILLLAFGINYAEFWGILIFLLHYIPFIGAIAAIVFVLIAVSIQITSLPVFVIMAIILTAIQFLVGNLLEPKWLGNRLNLSPIAILISLAFWGSLWGILGMFLCVPIMVIIGIILAQFPHTKSLAIMLSENGVIHTTPRK